MPKDAILLASRALLCAHFLLAGTSALSNIEGTAAYFAGLGFPAAMLVAWAVSIFELTAGLCLLLGFRTTLAAIPLALFCIAAGTIGNYGQGGENAALVFMHGQALQKDIAIAGGLLALAIAGAGRFSLDGIMSRR